MDPWDPLKVGKFHLGNGKVEDCALHHLREGRESTPGLGGKLPAGVMPVVPAKHPLPEAPESETVPFPAQLKMKQKGKSLGETELGCRVTEGLSNGQSFSPKANLGGRREQ